MRYAPQHGRATVVDIDVDDHERDVVRGQPLEAFAVFQPIPFQWLTAHNIAFVVVNININYRRPAVLGDVLTVTSQVQQLNGKSGVLSQVVTLDPEGQVVADALITFV